MTRAKQIRVLLLLMLLTPLVYAFSLPSNPAPSWDRTKIIAIYPYNSDGSEVAENYIKSLQATDFQVIENYLQYQARMYALPLQKPFEVKFGEPLEGAPPMPEAGATSLEQLSWALKLRWWHWRLDTQGLKPDIIVIARFHDGNAGPSQRHSIGMPKPRLALVNLIADPDHHSKNLVTLTHELLHTMGANDHYAFATGFPAWPEGFAQPDQEPLYPQTLAELMAGRIPLNHEIAREARSLDETIIGPKTARDIGWSAP